MSQHESTAVDARRQIVVAWAVLVSATVVAWWESTNPAIGVHEPALLAVTIIKVGIVMAVFMEITHAPAWLTAASLAWVAAVVAVVGTFLVATT
jgi:hypothetical protein